MPERLTVAEQIVLTTGADYWSTASFPAAGLRSLRLADGPHGLRIQDDENPDHLGLGRSLPASCFPRLLRLPRPGILRWSGRSVKPWAGRLARTAWMLCSGRG